MENPMTTQAEGPNTMSRLSRRGALAGLAGAAVAGVAPAIAVAGDDSELLSLKAKFDPLFATWVKMKIVDRNDHNVLVELFERATGLRFADRPAIDWDDPVFAAYQKAWEKFVDDYRCEQDDARNEDAWDNLLAELNPLASEILSYNASTLEGLRLQFRALISAYNEAWEPAGYEDEQPEHPWLRNFIESAAGPLGVPFPPF
jgi:hypothetical protein